MSVRLAPGAPELPPLAGFTVAVTAARRRDELGTLLERRGARVVFAPALRIVALSDDSELLAATHKGLAAPVGITIATTGIGFRGWMEAADGWGLGEQLRAHLGAGILLARGPKARGAIRAAGLVDAWSPTSESSSEILEYLLRQDLDGRRIAVQLHGEPLPDLVDAVRAAGAEVIEVPVYRWAPPEDTAPLRRLLDAILARQVDAVTFTSAPAVAGLLRAAVDDGVADELLRALRHEVLAACVGSVTAAPLERAGVPSVQPDRGRLGALVREIVSELPRRHAQHLTLAGRQLEIRGHGVVVDGRLHVVPPAPMAILRALARQPGRIVPRAALLAVLSGGATGEHAVEMAVARLRSALDDPRVVQTMVKRGYRLAYEQVREEGRRFEEAR